MTDSFSILLVDDDPNVIGLLGHILQEVGRLRFATCGEDALRMARQALPDLVLLDIQLPGMGGFEVITRMKEDPLLADVPVVLITAHEEEELEVTGLALGAADFITKPPRASQVLARVRMHLRMKQLSDALRQAAYLDGLTGVPNRRQFEETMQREWLRAQRIGAPISLLMLDIDAFKHFNDHYGHPAGDGCLKSVARALQRAVHRPADLAARYGGEEFAVLLPETDACGARFLASHLLQAVDALRIPHVGSPVCPHVTLSIGVSCHDGFVASSAAKEALSAPSELLAAADRALYAAKAAGRHQARYLALGDAAWPGGAAELALPCSLASAPPVPELRVVSPAREGRRAGCAPRSA